MKFTVIIAKDGTPYYHIESEDEPVDTPAGARRLADELDRAFAGYRADESPDDDRLTRPDEPRFKVVD